jgi:Cu-Zn family superoxide dismutase
MSARRTTTARLLAVAAAGSVLVVAAAALPAGAATGPVDAGGTFAAPADATTAFTYDASQVPVGARVAVHAVPTGSGRTVVVLHAWGLLPDETYGAHAHYLPCGATGTAAGAHYQNAPDPAVNGSLTAASTNPAYANPANEVWLDLVTNGDGNGRAQTVVDWPFRPTATGGPRSVILHLNPTSSGGTVPAGNAGARLACVTVPF